MASCTGDKIRKIRLERGLTQKQLGELCGIADSNIRKYELGTQNPKLQTLRKIAEALNVTLSELVVDWTMLTDEEIQKDFASAKLVSISDGEKTFVKAEDFHNYLYEKIIDGNLKLLNNNGKARLANYSADLTKIPEYRKEDK